MNSTVKNTLDDLRWSERPIEFVINGAPITVRTAIPSQQFWRAWSAHKQEFRALKIVPHKEDDEWLVVRPWTDKIVADGPVQCATRPTNGSIFPAPSGREFYEFQKAGIEFCLERKGAYVADEMGLGKTCQAIGVINCDESIQHVLIVTKASLKINWARELKMWLVRPLTVAVIDGSAWIHRNITILNYDLLVRHSDTIRLRKWDMIVLDESHYIKNRKSQRTRQVIGHTPSKKRQAAGEKVITPLTARRKICLSGTPIENRPEELWTSLHFLDPVRWPSFWPFAARYCDMRQTPFGLSTSGATNLRELRDKLLNKLVIRRRKSEVLPDLPPKTRVVVELDFNGVSNLAREEQQELGALIEGYEVTGDEERDFARAVAQLKEKDKLGGFAKISSLRYKSAMRKVPALIDAIKDDLEECAKALVFFHHEDVGRALSSAFENYVIITGKTDPKKRQPLCDKFQNDPSCRLFFGSTRACSEGLNLTAANLVIFAEGDWNPAKLSQAEDRAARIGQKSNVLVKHYVVPKTIDANMIRRAIEKQSIIDKVIK